MIASKMYNELISTYNIHLDKVKIYKIYMYIHKYIYIDCNIYKMYILNVLKF